MRYNGKSILIDCGEGTQIAMREKGWSPNPIDIICFTHFHADHISGLPGMLLTMGNAERTEPLLLIGPRGLTKVVASLRVIAPELPFEVKCIEITENAQTFSFEGFRLEAFRVNHNVLCYGYSMVIDRAGRFDKDRAMEQEIPMKFWSRLQKGETLEENGRVFTPDMVLGAERKGLKVTYSTDTRPTESIRQNSKGSDLLILEGMYGEPDIPIYGTGKRIIPRVEGRRDSSHFEKIFLPELLPIEEYDLVAILLSGGKDSIACYYKLLELGVPKERMEFWHHDIDGGNPERRMDWKCTQNYVRAFAEAEGVKLRLSWRVNGFFGELYRIGASEPVEWLDPDTGEVRQCRLSRNYLQCQEIKEYNRHNAWFCHRQNYLNHSSEITGSIYISRFLIVSCKRFKITGKQINGKRKSCCCIYNCQDEQVI